MPKKNNLVVLQDEEPFELWEARCFQATREELQCIYCQSGNLVSAGTAGNATQGGFPLIQVQCASEETGCRRKARLLETLKQNNLIDEADHYETILKTANERGLKGFTPSLELIDAVAHPATRAALLKRYFPSDLKPKKTISNEASRGRSKTPKGTKGQTLTQTKLSFKNNKRTRPQSEETDNNDIDTGNRTYGNQLSQLLVTQQENAWALEETELSFGGHAMTPEVRLVPTKRPARIMTIEDDSDEYSEIMMNMDDNLVTNEPQTHKSSTTLSGESEKPIDQISKILNKQNTLKPALVGTANNDSDIMNLLKNIQQQLQQLAEENKVLREDNKALREEVKSLKNQQFPELYTPRNINPTGNTNSRPTYAELAAKPSAKPYKRPNRRVTTKLITPAGPPAAFTKLYLKIENSKILKEQRSCGQGRIFMRDAFRSWGVNTMVTTFSFIGNSLVELYVPSQHRDTVRIRIGQQQGKVFTKMPEPPSGVAAPDMKYLVNRLSMLYRYARTNNLRQTILGYQSSDVIEAVYQHLADSDIGFKPLAVPAQDANNMEC